MPKKIVIVISASGLGHLTRQIALKNALIDLDPNLSIQFICTEDQLTFLKSAILTSEHVSVELLPLTPTITMESWSVIDVESTIDSYRKSWEFETQIRDDVEWGRLLYGADLIINDIECIHNPIAKKMDMPIVNISNFTWSDILFGINSFDLAEAYASWEKLATHHFQLPLYTECRGMSNPTSTKLVCRQIDQQKVQEIRTLTTKPIVLLIYSRLIWDMPIQNICSALYNEGYQIITLERFKDGIEDYDPILISTNEPKTQNFVAAANVVIGKVGYGLVSEVLTAGKPLIHWAREGFIEDNILSSYLIEKDQGVKVTPDIEINHLIKLVNEYVTKKFEPEENGTYELANQLLRIMDQETEN